MIDTLHGKRMEAAIASGGISSQAIYALVRQLCQNHRVEGDLLDFGAGTGGLLHHLTDSGLACRMTGADILSKPDSLPNAIQWMQADLNYPLPVADDSFDVIVSSEVIEHLENPRAVFREFSRLLRPQGKLIVTTPNQESIRSLLALLIQGHFVAFGDNCYPAHITALLRKDFERICNETGFAPPQFSYTNLGGLPKAPHIPWQKISLGLLTGRLFSDNMALVAVKKESHRSEQPVR